MPKTGSNIYKRRDGRWEGRFIKGYSEKGAVYGYVYASTCGEVKRKLMAVKAAPPATAGPSARLTFAAVAAQWQAGLSLRVKPSTEDRYNWLLRRHILPCLGGLRLNKLTAGQIEAFSKEKLTGEGLAAKTVRDMLSVVKLVLGFAQREGFIAGAVTIVYPRRQAKTMRVLSPQEQTALEKVLRRDMNIYKFGVLLCLYTGLRVGEVCALRHQDISLSSRLLSVRRTVQRVENRDGGPRRTQLTTNRPKSKNSERDIPLPAFLMELLSRFMRTEGDYLLSSREKQCLEPRTLQNHFQRFLREAGVAPANFHALRHTFSTRCIEAGVDVKSLSEILGHADVRLTLNLYVHSSLEQKRAAMNKLELFTGAD
jgi:integrase